MGDDGASGSGRMAICNWRQAHASDSGRQARFIARMIGRHASFGITAMPSPEATMWPTASKLRTRIRSLSLRSAARAAWCCCCSNAAPDVRLIHCSSSVSTKAIGVRPASAWRWGRISTSSSVRKSVTCRSWVSGPATKAPMSALPSRRATTTSSDTCSSTSTRTSACRSA